MISQIFHIADIHIRKGNYYESRFTEYKKVFDNLYNDIKKIYIPNRCITVICGDIFHHKLQISSNGIILFYHLIHSIADIMPVFIIQGNHDLIQENNDENNDLIKALLHDRQHENVRYIDSTDSFDYDTNLHFGVVSIRDMLQRCSGSGMVDDLPLFPEPNKEHNRVNVAISHATVLNCTLHNYTKAISGVPIEWYKGYDLVLLGDVHLQSAKYSKKHSLYYGYPGSLIQQDFGESIYNHGFLLWNIDENNRISLEKYHVLNEFGRANVRIDAKGSILINSENYETLETFVLRDKLPKELHVRIYCKEDTDTISLRDKLEKTLRQKNIDVKIVCTSNMLHDINSSCSEETENMLNASIKDLTSSNTIIEFFKTNGNENILKSNTDWENIFINLSNLRIPLPTIDVSEQISSLIQSKNDKIIKRTEGINNSGIERVQNVLRITEVVFDWILAFGKTNCFVFSMNTITLINAPNGYGKSAFFECIMLGLFGETIPSRYNRNTALSILNKRKPPNTDSSSITISFVLNDTNQYRIEREFHEYTDSRNKNVQRLGSNKVELYENDVLIKTGNKLVNTWISTNVCSSQDFLLSTMITQNFDNDFFKLKPTEQSELLDSVLNMNIVNSMSSIINDTRKDYKDLKNHIETFIEAKRPANSFDCSEYDDMISKRKSLISDIRTNQEMYDRLYILPSKHYRNDLEQSDESLETLLDKESVLTKKLNALGMDITDTPQTYELYELSTESFVDDNCTVKPNRRRIDKLVNEYKCRQIQDIIVKYRECCDTYDYAVYNLNNIVSSRPKETTEHTMQEYNQYMDEYNTIRKKAKKVVVVNEPNFDQGDVQKPVKYEEYKDMDDDELMELSKQTSSGESSSDYANNPDCWACNQNFGSEKSRHATAVLQYRRALEHLRQWESYEKKKHLITKFNELEAMLGYWKRMVSIIDATSSYNTQYEEYNQKMMQKLSEKVDIGYSIVEVIEYQRRCNTSASLLEELHSIQNKKMYYSNEKLRLKILIDKLNKELNNIEHKIGSMELIRDQEMSYNEVKIYLQDTISLLERRIPMYVHFVETFTKYKSWIYNQKVLPVIVNKTNAILNTLFTDRTLKLSFHLNDTDILFTVQDEGNCVNMEKLSGAQSFAVSLSFRLALSAVGITRFRCNQLFIDEGFCSFDQNNLLNVPVLIKNLKQIYEEIVLVTHLEEIKSCADKVVHIRRQDGISFISNK